MFAASSLVLTATDQSTNSSGNNAARVSTSESLGFIEALDGESIKPAENRLPVSFSSVQRIGSLLSDEISQSFATHDAAAKSSSFSEAPTELLTLVNRSKMPSALENLREALGSLRSVLKHSMTPGSAAPDVETIFGQFTKAVSEFDLESGTTLLTTLNSDQLAFPGLESRDWSLSHSSGETDHAAAFDLLNLIASTLRKTKSLSPVVEEGSGSVLSSKPGNSKKTPSPNTNLSSADVFNRADAPMVSVKEAPNGQTVSYVAQFRSTLPSVLGMANDKPVQGQDMAAGTRVTLTSSGSREGVSGGLAPTEGNTDRPTLLNAQGSRSLWSSLAQGEHPLQNKPTNDFAVTKPKPEIVSGMALERASKAQDLAAGNQTLLTSNANRTTKKTDAQRSASEVNQSSVSEPVARLDRALQADAPIGRSVDRPSGRRPVNAIEAGEFDPRTKASLEIAGPRSKLGVQAPFSAIFQHNQVIASPSEFKIADLSLFREADVSTTLELGQNGLVSGLPAAEAKAERSTLLTAQASRPTGFSIALTEQMRGVSARDGVTKVQLSPRGLGTIEVEVATDVDNTTNIVIRSDNSVVLSALKDVRDLVSQVLNLDSGGTLNFEESTGKSDAQSGEDARDQEVDVDVSQSGGVTSGGMARIDVIGGDVLDIMA